MNLQLGEMTKYGGDVFNMLSINTYNLRLYVPFCFPSPHPRIATKPSERQQPSGSLVGAPINYVELSHFYIFYVYSSQVNTPVIKIRFHTSSSSHRPCEAGTGSCRSWQSAAVSQREWGWFQWCLYLMHFVSWDEPTVKAEGRLVRRRWKSGVVSSHSSAPDELQHHWSMPTPLACHCSVPVRAAAVTVLNFKSLTFARHPQLSGQK